VSGSPCRCHRASGTSRPWAASHKAEAATLALVHRGVHGAPVGVERDIDGAGDVVAGENLLPRGPAVGGAVDPTIVVRSPQVPQRRDKDRVGVPRVDHHAPDVVRLLEPHVRPRLATVERPVDPVSPRGTLAIVGLPGPHPHDPGIARRDGNVTDRRAASVAIEDRGPRRPVVGGAEHPASGRPHEDRRRPTGNRLDVVDAPPERRRADVAPGERTQILCGERRSEQDAGKERLGKDGEATRGHGDEWKECDVRHRVAGVLGAGERWSPPPAERSDMS
jgi:hypothetical protein